MRFFKRSRWVILFLTVFLFVNFSVAFSQEKVVSPLVEELEKMERILYGVPQSGGVLTRIEQIERDLIGDTLSGTLAERVDTLKRFILTGTPEEPSLEFKIKAVRLTLNAKPSESGILTAELDELERLVFGVTSDQPIGVRVDHLYRTCVDINKIKAFTVTVPAGTLVKISIDTELHSERNNKGDAVPFTVVEDVKVEDILVIPAGTKGVGTITKLKRRGSFGKPGLLEIDFGEVPAIDGTMISLTMGEKAIQENKSVAYAVGASIAGLAVFGPIGAVAGIFVQGEPAKVEAGTELFVEVAEEAKVSGPLVAGEYVPGGGQELVPAGEEVPWGEETPSYTDTEKGSSALDMQEVPQVEVEIRPLEEWGEEVSK